MLAAQDFRHTIQREAEPVSDFVRHLERTFQIAYRRDVMSAETRDTHKTSENALDYLSDSEEGDVCLIRVHDKGSKQRCAVVEVQGVEACGVVDTGRYHDYGGSFLRELQQ